MALDASDAGMAPTLWQQSRFPTVYRSGIRVIHDGIDTDRVTPGRPEEELVTYVSRNLEPYRGFHTFMRAIPEIQRRRPKARIVIVGGDEVSYSPRLPEGRTYRQRLLAELDGRIDLSRVRFMGRVPYSDYLALLRRSAAHVYLTYPFVLSWSMLEAMSAGCLVVGSRTAPVQEVLRDGENGFFVDFFSPQAIAERVAYALEHQADLQPLRQRARQTVVERYDLRRVCLPAQLRLVESLQRQRADARAAADVQHLAGDKPGVAVGEEHHRSRDVLGLA
jgi:glycosyltransferase involved in cell wall biosynthesis